MKTARALYAE
jgi:solute carrier family 25 (mitochondrial iron transporter), member 28/37